MEKIEFCNVANYFSPRRIWEFLRNNRNLIHLLDSRHLVKLFLLLKNFFREVKIKKTKRDQLMQEKAVSSDETTKKIRIWNPTVANLTLMVVQFHVKYIELKQ